MTPLVGKKDLFPAGTYKTSDNTLPHRVKGLKTYDTCTVTSGKYTDGGGTERVLDLKLLTQPLADGVDITFPRPLHEIIIAGSPGEAFLIFD